MIDLITMVKTGVSENEVLQIIEDNRLKTNTKDSIVYYDNEKMKFADGFFIRIETNSKRLKLECSLHKYFSYLHTGQQSNFDLFSFSNTKSSIDLLKQNTGIDIDKLKVTYYEIGLNMVLNGDCKEYINQIQSIGISDNRKQFYINPRYKGERIKTTVFHRHIKKVFKVYDKIHEMRDKKRNIEPTGNANILRIETIQRRVENMTVSNLMDKKTIKKLTDQFVKDWRTVQFIPTITAPKGTHQIKIELCQQILLFGKSHVLNHASEDYQKGNITEKQHRRIKQFVNSDWDIFKDNIKVTKSEKELEFREKIFKTTNVLKY